MAIGRIPEPGTGIQESIVDAKGDLISATAADTPARLAVGANGTTLVADSSEATGLKWATPSSGGMSLLSTTTLSGASVSITNISQDFIKLFVLMIDAHGNDVASDLQYTFNSDTTGGNYYSKMLDIFNAGIGNSENFSTGHFGYGRKSRQNTQLRKLNGYLTLHNYTSTGTKFADILNTSMTEGTNTALVQGGGIYIGGSAISSIQVKLSAGTFTDGSVLIFGVK